MKKTISFLLVAAMAMTGMTAMAQNDGAACKNQVKCAKSSTECVNHHKACDKDKKQCCSFEGLNLTEQQKTALQNIPTPRQAMKALKEQQKADMKERIEADKAQRIQVVKDIRSNYLNSVKAVLSPEQYVQFLENNYINQFAGDKARGAHYGKDFKGKKAGRKGPRQGNPATR